jgi:hypothetical protein
MFAKIRCLRSLACCVIEECEAVDSDGGAVMSRRGADMFNKAESYFASIPSMTGLGGER